jgi:hypothetical protein
MSSGEILSFECRLLADSNDLWRRLPTYVGRIFKGDKPLDLPIQLSTKFEMAII